MRSRSTNEVAATEDRHVLMAAGTTEPSSQRAVDNGIAEDAPRRKAKEPTVRRSQGRHAPHNPHHGGNGRHTNCRR